MNFKLFAFLALAALVFIGTTDAATNTEGRMVKRAAGRMSKRGDYESTSSVPNDNEYSSGSSSGGDDYGSDSSSGDDYDSGSSKSSGSSSGGGNLPRPGGKCLYDVNGNLATATTNYCPGQIIPKGGDSDPDSGDDGSTCTVNSAGKLLDADLLPCSNVCILTKSCPKQNKCKVSDSGLIVASVLPCSNVEILTGILRK